MKVVIAIDSFKGSLSSLEAGNAIKQGILQIYPDAEVAVRPLADGGEGTVEALALGMGGSMEKINVTGPLGRPVDCEYGILDDNNTAIIEMSGAAGITLVKEDERNPLNTTTYGVGEVILNAIHKGCKRFIVGIGGSATNDCGIGMLQALGFKFLDEQGKQVSYGAKGIKDIITFTDEDVIPELKECTFKVACDVSNPLCGATGCSAVYGPQKGATASMVSDMDRWLKRFAQLVKRKYPQSDAQFPGTGAAGGLGFAFKTFTNGSLESGIRIVLDETKLEDHIKDADIVVTGEGRLDGQTMMGKAPIGVAAMAKKYEKPVLAFSGCVTEDAIACNEHGIDAFFPILRNIVTLSEAMNGENAKKNLIAATVQAFRLIKAFR